MSDLTRLCEIFSPDLVLFLRSTLVTRHLSILSLICQLFVTIVYFAVPLAGRWPLFGDCFSFLLNSLVDIRKYVTPWHIMTIQSLQTTISYNIKSSWLILSPSLSRQNCPERQDMDRGPLEGVFGTWHQDIGNVLLASHLDLVVLGGEPSVVSLSLSLLTTVERPPVVSPSVVYIGA